MKNWKIPKAIIVLFSLYLAIIFFFAFIYHRLYQNNIESFIIHSAYIKNELRVIDSLENLHIERTLIEENEKLNIRIERTTSTLKVYHTILQDSLRLNTNIEGKTPPILLFDKTVKNTQGKSKYPIWIRVTANPEFIFYPKFENPAFRYNFSITDHIDNYGRPNLEKRLNINLQFSNKLNSDSIVHDNFQYYANFSKIQVTEFYNGIIKHREKELSKILRKQEKQLTENTENLEKHQKKSAYSTSILGFGDFFYLSTNIQTTGDTIDILPNKQSVRIWLAAQRILSVIVVALIFTYYIEKKKDQ